MEWLDFSAEPSERNLTKSETEEESKDNEKTGPPATASERFVEMFGKAAKKKG